MIENAEKIMANKVSTKIGSIISQMKMKGLISTQDGGGTGVITSTGYGPVGTDSLTNVNQIEKDINFEETKDFFGKLIDAF